MGIDYRFNEWRVSGEKVETWSPMAYKLVSKCMNAERANGYRIGHILYLFYYKGLSYTEIKEVAGQGLHMSLIKGIIKGFGKDASMESREAFKMAMYMIEHETEVLDKMYFIKTDIAVDKGA